MEEENKNKVRLFGGIVGLIIIVLVVLAAFPVAFVGAGERGVIFNNVSGVEDRILGEGIHLRVPFVQSVHKMSIKVQKNDVKAEAASKDLQTVSTDIVVNWHLDAGKVNKVYQNIGDEKVIVDRIIVPAVNEVVKAATAKYTAEESISKRQQLKTDIDTILTDRLITYNVILDDVSIVNIDFSPEFNKAIESKQIAEQDAKRAQFVADMAAKEAEAEVNRAKGSAEAQRLQQTTLTELLLQKQYLEKWDGHLPTYVAGNSGTMLFNLPTK